MVIEDKYVYKQIEFNKYYIEGMKVEYIIFINCSTFKNPKKKKNIILIKKLLNQVERQDRAAIEHKTLQVLEDVSKLFYLIFQQ